MRQVIRCGVLRTCDPCVLAAIGVEMCLLKG